MAAFKNDYVPSFIRTGEGRDTTSRDERNHVQLYSKITSATAIVCRIFLLFERGRRILLLPGEKGSKVLSRSRLIKFKINGRQSGPMQMLRERCVTRSVFNHVVSYGQHSVQEFHSAVTTARGISRNLFLLGMIKGAA